MCRNATMLFIRLIFASRGKYEEFYKFLILGLFFVLASCGGSGTPVAINYAPELSNQYGLNLIGADTINSAGYTGSGIKVAVVDSGIDSSHSEFSGKTIYGKDFGGSTNGYTKDDDGHGTHVASIIGANKDAVGMRGVAYDATLYSYRVANDSGILSGVNTDSNRAAVFNQHVTDNIRVSNNSWGTKSVIGDYSESYFRTYWSNTISALRSAQQNGTVFVWATGNNGCGSGSSPEGCLDANVHSGLPYRVSELANEWLAVMAVDSNLQETKYTHRCGNAKSFCVTAPGGGDDQSDDGIYAAQANGTYVRLSGTSMAAPHVSGVVATTMEQFPNLTAAQIVTRIKDTAVYTGLKGYGANGCTSSTCTTAQMEAIFGHGLISSAASTSMISSAGYSIDGKVYSDNNLNVSAKKLYVVPGLSTKTRGSIGNVRTTVFDTFDGATFNVSAKEVFDTASYPVLSTIGYTGKQNGLHSDIFNSQTYDVRRISFDELDFYMISSNDLTSLAALSLWGDNAGFMPKPSFMSPGLTNQLEVSMIDERFLTLRPFAQYTNSDSINPSGYGMSASVTPNKNLTFYGALASSKGDFNLGATESSTAVSQGFKSIDLGAKLTFSDSLGFMVRSSLNKLDNTEAGTNYWGMNEASFSQAVFGFQIDLKGPKLTIGGYQPSQYNSGDTSILMASGRNLSGNVSYQRASFDIESEATFGAFISASIPLSYKEKKYGGIDFNLQQSPYDHDKIGRASLGLNYTF
ncbi:MAG: S8 family peptidase [Paracoccaceae bacterium]